MITLHNDSFSYNCSNTEAVAQVFCKKGVLRNFAKFTGKQVCNFIKKETLAQVFSYEFCEISKNTFFYRTILLPASDATRSSQNNKILSFNIRHNFFKGSFFPAVIIE